MDPLATAEWRIDRIDGGVRLLGRLRMPDAAALMQAVRESTAGVDEPVVDFADAEQVDGAVVAVLRADLAGKRVRLRAGDRFQPLFEIYANVPPPPPYVDRAEPVVAHVGRVSAEGVAQVSDILAFTGQTALAAGRSLRTPQRGYWRELPRLIEGAGADALPIVGVINFLIGFVLAYMAAHALQTFGANAYVADLVGIGMTRQLGPVMTAIVVAGRSGAAYTTELGSMKINQEIDALRTLGIEPYRWLVIPRLLTLVLVTPALTVLSNLLGMAGGLLVALTSLGLTARGYLDHMRAILRPWDIASGLVMSVAFALAIGLIACEQGFAASGGPQGVGRRTTHTVVTSLFAIVLLDAGITVLYRAYGVS